MSDQFGLSTQTIQKIQNVFSKYSNIEKEIIYGSRAMGNYQLGSDIDLTVMAPLMTLSELLKIENEIDDLYLPYKLDISLYHQIENPDLKNHIERRGQIFYAP
jgi:predicted nucleotidyltransferase